MKRILSVVLVLVLIASVALAITTRLEINSEQSVESQIEALKVYLESLSEKDRDKWIEELFMIGFSGLSSTTTLQPSTVTPKQQGGTIGQNNALKTAKQYIDYSAFSYSGLIAQLEYEGYSKEDAKYGVDNCGADWNEQAVKCAKSYLEYSSFSKKGLIEQLEYEGFTRSQAEYGVSHNGY